MSVNIFGTSNTRTMTIMFLHALDFLSLEVSNALVDYSWGKGRGVREEECDELSRLTIQMTGVFEGICAGHDVLLLMTKRVAIVENYHKESQALSIDEKETG